VTSPGQATVPLSVVLTTKREPGSILRNVDGLRCQVRALGGEFLVVSSVAATLPLPADVRVHQVADGSIFDCRAAALSLARGDIIAFTEDHCVHPPDWCERILRNFATRPDLMLLGGAVDNGSNRRIDDLMNYWTTFAPYAPGQVIAPHPCIAQFIVRASSIDRSLRPGGMEGMFIEAMHKVPGAIYLDPELVVRHEQSHGFWNTFAVHYHNGRATGGFSSRRAERGNPPRLKSLSWACEDLAAHIRRSQAAFREGKKPFHVRAWYLTMILPLILAHGIGAAIGYRKGPGGSPHRLV
jgi:hypothetical protein